MSGCTTDTVYVPPGTHILSVRNGTFAILECDLGYMFPTASDGIYWCENDIWIGSIPGCIRKYMLRFLSSLMQRLIIDGLLPFHYITVPLRLCPSCIYVSGSCETCFQRDALP